MAQEKVYLDHNATTPVSSEIRELFPLWLDQWGNASSIHQVSRGPKTILRETRKLIADCLQIHPHELIFTSGGTESNNTIIQGVFRLLKNQRPRLICSAIEHPSVLKTMKVLIAEGAEVITIPVSRDGFLDMEFYKNVVNEQTALVSIMGANNEIGSLFPIQELATIAHEKGALFHVDAVQLLGKTEIDLKNWNVDYASFSGHKWNALKGSGIIYVKKSSPFQNLVIGGGQERSRRGGTENILSIASLGESFKKWNSISIQTQKMTELRDYFESRMLTEFSGVHVTAQKSLRLGNTSSLVINGVDGETLLMSLDLKGFMVSTGAACSSGSPEPSPVLLSIGLSREEAQSSLRISIGWETTKEEMDQFIETLKSIVERLRNLNHKGELSDE